MNNQFQQRQMKTVEEKLAECRQVIIQNVEKSIQNTMIFRYLKEAKIDSNLKKYILNNKDGFISMEFHTAEQAKEYYENANFKHKVLIRPFNIYFNLQLNEDEMKKYYFEGLTEENMRRMFEIARTVGVVKIYTSYTSVTSSGKLKPNGILSFIRKNDISEAEFASLQQNLDVIGVKLSPYKAEKGIKCSVILTNFFQGNFIDDEEKMNEAVRAQADNLIRRVTKNPETISQVSPIVKRRQVPAENEKEGQTKTVTKIKAIVEFKTSQNALDNFESIRTAFIREGEAQASLNFHNSETNSYISLFTSNLAKPDEKMSDKVFEDELVKCFRNVNKDVVQVNVFPVAFNKTYVARVYLREEAAGKDFIVDFPTKRDFLIKYYKDVNNIRFNINVDDKTMKKIKAMQKRAQQITINIKNQTDNQKRAKKAPNQMQLMPNMPNMGNMGMNMPPNMGMNMPPNMGMPNMTGPPRNFVPGNRPGFPMGPPQMGMGGMGGMGVKNMMPPQQNPEAMITRFLQEKRNYVEASLKDGTQDKRIRGELAPSVKFTLENKLGVNSTDSHIQMNLIVKKNDVATIIDFLATPKDMYTKIQKQ